MKKIIVNDRKSVSNEIIKCIKQKTQKVFLISGAKGSGRKYVLKLIQEELKDNFRIFSLFENEIFELNKKHKKYVINTEINLSHYAGIAFSVTQNRSSKLNYIISNLKRRIKKRPICFIVPNVDRINDAAIDFLKVLTEYSSYISNQIGQPIYFVFSAKKDYVFNFAVDLEIELQDYDKNAIKTYLLEFLNYSNDMLIDKDKQVDTLYKLCGSNLNLVNSIHRNIIYSENQQDINTLLHEKIIEYLDSGKKDNLGENDMRLILYISSMCLCSFNKKIVTEVSHCSENIVELCLKYAREEYFLERLLDNYDFISPEIKKCIEKKAIENYKSRFIDFYNFISVNNEEEYLQRAIYLQECRTEHSLEILALLLLAVSRASVIKDENTKIKVYEIATHTNQEFVKILNNYVNAIELSAAGEYLLSNKEIDKINTNYLNQVALAVILRLKMSNLQLCFDPHSELRKLSRQLLELVKNPLTLNLDNRFTHEDEYILKLSIIYDLAPYFLDDENDQDTFNELFKKSQEIDRMINLRGGKCAYAKYMINVFYRKAFLYATPENSIVYYNQALHYFQTEKIYEQVVITLSSRAGMKIAIHDYEEAVKDCIEAIKLMNSKGLVIPQSKKVTHNLLIAKFLLYEEKEPNLEHIHRYAAMTINKLKKILPDTHSALKHVTLTNIASLHLYRLDIKQYKETKKLIEISLNCNDVSDIKNENVNDFYRYYFAWYEFYASALEKNWETASAIIESLEGFRAVLMKNEAKHKAMIQIAQHIIKSRDIPSSYDYCTNMAQHLPNISKHIKLRGLMLSDLQFTSYD